jgi:hypothetical protein
VGARGLGGALAEQKRVDEWLALAARPGARAGDGQAAAEWRLGRAWM